MTEILAYPLNTASFNNEFYDATDAQTYTCTRLTGVYSSETDLKVVVTGGRGIVVTEGLAWLNFDRFRGIATANTVEKNGIVAFTINPSVTLPRIDRVVVSYNFNEDKVEILLRQGMPASNPQPPGIQRDGSYYEIALADIAVAVGSGNIIQANITDLRLNESLCGIMRDGVTGIPTQQLYDQFNSWFNTTKSGYDSWFYNFKNDNQTNFDNWFNAIKLELEGFDPAAILADLEYIKNNAQMWRLTEIDGTTKYYLDTDLNNAIYSGFYHYNQSNTNRPPDATSGLLRVIVSSEHVYHEIYDTFSGTWQRYRNNSGIWSAWGNVPKLEQTPPLEEWISLPLTGSWTAREVGVKYHKDVFNNVTLIVDVQAVLENPYEIIAFMPEAAQPLYPVTNIGVSETGYYLVGFWGGGGGIIKHYTLLGADAYPAIIFQTTYKGRGY